VVDAHDAPALGGLWSTGWQIAQVFAAIAAWFDLVKRLTSA
jgi:hypothetical protein